MTSISVKCAAAAAVATAGYVMTAESFLTKAEELFDAGDDGSAGVEGAVRQQHRALCSRLTYQSTRALRSW